MSNNRYIGDYPVIGIRPTIDGRRGPMQLRESLENQTMNMALAAKKLFEENLYYSNGEPVKVIVADTTIGRVPESAACENKFKKEGVAITLTVTPCWCYGAETMDMDPNTIKGVWGFNGTERPGAVYLASVLATHAQKGLPAFGIYGHEVQDIDDITNIPEDVKEKQWEFTVKMYCIIKDLMCGNKNLPEQFKEEMVGHNAIAGGFQGQRQWTDHWPNCDYPEALLSSTFDHNGAREPYTLATENDILNGLGMLFMRLLTGRGQIFADVRTYWSGDATKRVTGYDLEGKAKESDGIIHLLNSGAACLDATGVCTDENGNAVMKRWWEVTDEDIKKMTDATKWCEAGFDNFRGGGFSSSYTTRAEMPATMIRLNLVKGLGPVLQIAEGWTVKLPDEVSDKLMERTNPTWPCTWFAPRTDGKEGSPFKTAYEVMQNWGANHGAISYGHIGADLITMCSMLRIPVCMHNVPSEKIFRPAAWNAFGMDKEGADYRACAAYGPCFKK